MHAVTLSHFGDPAVLRYAEIENPVPGPGEVLVRVRACGINHLDLDIRAGQSRYAIAWPHVLGREMAGEVVAVGPDLSREKVPQRVLVRSYFTCGKCAFCRSGQDNHCPEARLPGLHCWGGYAELMVAPAGELIPLPDSLTFIDAAASQIAFGTAWRSLAALGQVQAGQRVLILGAGGGVGTAAVQVATLWGAAVLAATRRAENRAILESLGARVLVAGSVAELVRQAGAYTNGSGVDLILDPVGGDYTVAALTLLAPGGRLVVCGAHTGEVVPVDLVKLFRNQTHVIGSRRAVRADLDRVLPLIASGRLRPVLDMTAPLREAADMHRRIAAGEHTGKIVLIPED